MDAMDTAAANEVRASELEAHVAEQDELIEAVIIELLDLAGEVPAA